MIFYVMERLKSAFNKKGFYEVASEGTKINFGELYRCPKCEILISPKPWLPPINIKLRGKHFGDLCALGGLYEFFISKKFVTLWKESGLTGLNIFDYPVNIKKSSPLNT